jgi:hypothetical protein
VQQFKPFRNQRNIEDSDARKIAARPAEARNEASIDRVSTTEKK